MGAACQVHPIVLLVPLTQGGQRMSAQFRGLTRGRGIATTALLFAWSISTQIAAEEEAPTNVRNDLPAHLVVFRVSERTLNSLIADQPVDRVADVRDSILGTAIYGKARIRGKLGLQLADHPEQATFQLTLTGQAHSRTTGYNGPVIIYSRSVTTFTATKQIVFEPGKGFHELPSQVTARTQTFVEGIGSTRCGLIGRIVRRRAARIAAQRHAEATEIARQKAERRIAVTFDRISQERLARLNRVASFRALTATALLPARDGEPTYACCTTPYYLQIASSFNGRESPIELPVTDTADLRGAPIQIWFHESLVGDRVAAALDLLQAQISASEFLKIVSTTMRVIGSSDEFSSQSGSSTADPTVRIRKAGDWRIIEVEMPTDDSRAGTSEFSPR